MKNTLIYPEVKLMYFEEEDLKNLREIGNKLNEEYKPEKKSFWSKMLNFFFS